MLRWMIACVAVGSVLTAAAEPAAAQDVVGQVARDLQAAHRTAKGRGVTIALLFDGVDPGLNELSGRLRAAPDLIKVKESEQRYGTLLASLIAGKGTLSGQPVKGIAPAARILSVRVAPTGQKAYRKFVKRDMLGALAKGIRYAADHGADVILMGDARGDHGNTPELAAAVDYALKKKIVLIAAADRLVTFKGRRLPVDKLAYPAAIPGVIAVGSADTQGRWNSKETSRNTTVQMAAPAPKAFATGDRNQDGWYIWGSAVSASLVAGTAALIKEKHPELSPALVARAMTGSARHRPDGGYSTSLGHGLVNPAGALKAAGKLNRLRLTTAAGADGHFGGGTPATPVKAVKWDEKLLLRSWAIAGGGAALVLLSLVLAVVGVVRGRRRRRARSATVIPMPSPFARPPAAAPHPAAPTPEVPPTAPSAETPRDQRVWPTPP